MKLLNKLLWRLYFTYLLIIILSLVASALYSSAALRDFHLDSTADDLMARAGLVRELTQGLIEKQSFAEVDSLCKKVGKDIDTRFTVILSDGLVVGDSQENPQIMDNHADRPEIIQALSGVTGSSSRFSSTLEKQMMYVAIPLKDIGNNKAVIRASMPLPDINKSLREIYFKLAAGGLIIALITMILGVFIARWINSPLQDISQGAKHFADGDLAYRLPESSLIEAAIPARAMNNMARNLDERIKMVTAQRNELDTVLENMTEAVIVLSEDHRILRFNKAAGQFFDLDPNQAQDRLVNEINRNTDLQNFIKDLENEKQLLERELLFTKDGERFLQAYGTAILGHHGGKRAYLVVLHDITRLKRLENVRKDFIANVSHELKTPITSIKGFVETLLSGTVKDEQKAKSFLEIIFRHSERLDAIINDLLSLSRIEKEGERNQISFQLELIQDVLQGAVYFCQTIADEKKVRIDLNCPIDLCAQVNPHLLEQAIVNLVENAIKYSPSGSTIGILAKNEGKEVVIEVSDSGPGIDPEHLPRIFERFYRVDKARSCKLGGTGLGLAIVKHIVNVHKGQVTVQSRLDKGSVFKITLPISVGKKTS